MIQEIIKKYNGVAVIDSNSTYSFSDLNNQINKYASSLKDVVVDNDSILICSDYNFFSISLLIYLSSKKINIIPVVKTTKKEIDDKILESRPTKVIYLNSKGKILLETPNLNKEKNKILVPKNNTGLILFSSGTTGKPKVMVQNLSKLISSIQVPKKQKSLIFLIFLMFDHIGGINTLLRCLICGSPIVVPHDRKPSTIIRLIEKHKVNVLPTSPTFLNLLLLDDKFNRDSFKSLKLITYGTERMPEILLNKIYKLFPSIKLMQTFGTSETEFLKHKVNHLIVYFLKLLMRIIHSK